jgi:hypothetical protein
LARPSLRLIRGKQLEWQSTLLTEQETTNMRAVRKQLATKAGAEVSQDPALAVLEQATQPEK